MLCLKRDGDLFSVTMDCVLTHLCKLLSSKSPNSKNISQGIWGRPTGAFTFTRLSYEMFQMNNWFSVTLIRKAALIILSHSFYFFPSGCWFELLTWLEKIIWWCTIWFRTPYSTRKQTSSAKDDKEIFECKI